MAVKASASITIFDVTDGADGASFAWNLFRNTFGESEPYTLTGTGKDIFISEFSKGHIYSSVSFKAGDIITVQAESDCAWSTEHSTSGTNEAVRGKPGFWLYYGTQAQVQIGSYVTPLFIAGDGTSTKLTATITVPTVTDVEDIYIAFRLNTYSDGETSVSVKVWNIKLERGSTASAWCPAQDDVEEAIDNAAKVATNYIKVQDGLIVGDHTASTLGKNVLIDDDSVDIRNGSTVLASYGDTITLGQANGWNTYINSSTVDIRYNGTIYATFGTTATIGLASARNIYIDSDSVDIRNGSTVLASFGEETVIGQKSAFALAIDSNYVSFIDGNEKIGTIGSDAGTGYGLTIDGYVDDGTVGSSIYVANNNVNIISNNSFTVTTNSTTIGSASGPFLTLDSSEANFYSTSINATSSVINTYVIHNSTGIYSYNWFRSYNATGWYNETYGGGIYMEDSTYVRIFNGKYLYTTGEVVCGSVTGNGLRLVCGNYGVIFRNDGNAFYLLLTNKGDPYGSWNDYRPFNVNLSNGNVHLEQTTTLNGVISESASFRPVSDAGRTLGLSSYRWGKIYSSSSSISTSDEREKDIIGVANDDVFEQMFMALKPIKYRWKYQEQTDPGIHLGLGAQTVEQSMAALGLTTDDFAVIEHDTLEEVDEHGQADRYGMNYQQVDMLTLIMTQKNVRKIQELESEKETTAALLESLQYQLTQAFDRIAELENQLNQLSA